MHIGCPKIVSCGFLILFSSLITIVSNQIYDVSYYDYLLAVIQHFKYQNGWRTMEHITVVSNDRSAILRVEEMFQEDLSISKNSVQLYNKIAELVNCRYVEILNKLFILLADVKNECYHFYQINPHENFVNCVILLQDILSNSKVLFKNLYAALTFLSLIDIKLVHVKSTNYSKYIVDELYYVKSYLSSMEQENFYKCIDGNGNPVIENAFTVLRYVDSLGLTILERLKGIAPEDGNVFVEPNMEVQNLKEIYEYGHKNKHKDFVSFMSMKINNFMNEVADNDFKHLGFLELMYPSSTE